MEVKQKAKEIFDNIYHNVVYHSNGHDNSKTIAKINAIISVDEIIKVFYYLNPNGNDSILLEELNYWKEVRLEIITL